MFRTQLLFSQNSSLVDFRRGSKYASAYRPVLKYIIKIINTNLHLSYMDQEAKKVLPPKAMVSLRSARKLSNCLLRAKFYPVERKVESFNIRGLSDMFE